MKRKRAADSPTIPLSEFEWNFDNVPDAELHICCVWEYGRESAFLRSIRERSGEAARLKLPFRERLEFVDRDFGKAFSALGRTAILFQEGIYGFGGDKVYQEFVSRFPVPWQLLSEFERSVLLETAAWDVNEAVGMPGFRRSNCPRAEGLAKLFRPKAMKDVFPGDARVQVRDYFHAGHKLRFLCPNLMYPCGLEVLAVEIDWGNFTNEQLVKEFAKWLKENDPPGIQRPDKRGQNKAKDWRALLARLAVMRLLARFTPLQIVDPRFNKFPEVWKTEQFAGRKWYDVSKWHDARREAGKAFRKFFHFLPIDEKPLCWKRQAPGK